METTDIDPYVNNVRVVKKLSGKTGKPYNIFVVELVNGYEIEMFLPKAEIKLLDLITKQAATNK